MMGFIALFAGAATAQQSTHPKPFPSSLPSNAAQDREYSPSSPLPGNGLRHDPAPAAPSRSVSAQSIGVEDIAGNTRVTVRLSDAADYQVFRLRDPDRVVVDFAGVAFRMSAGQGRRGAGVVAGFRFGAFAPGRSRIVIATTGPVKIEATRLVADGGGRPGPVKLEIDLAAVSSVELAASEVAAAAESLRPFAPQPETPPPRTLMPSPSTRHGKPVIVIDPGHGGIDSGALGTVGVEKDIVLAVARGLAASLRRSGRFTVHLTREGDVFVPLEQRLRLAAAHEADVFVSIHADSLDSRALANAIRGASIYSLSARASDDRARRLAEKENAADLLAGVTGIVAEAKDQVQSILLDLMKRETADLSLVLRRQLGTTLRKEVRMSKDSERSANFVVLRQPGTPSVLVELGYMSHPEDERLMMSADWQRKVALAIASAVERYFSRTAGSQKK